MKKKAFLIILFGMFLFISPLRAQTWEETKRLTWNAGSSGPTAIATDSTNNIHVVWVDDTPGNYEIYYKKSTNGGSTWISTMRLTWTSGYSFSPAIATDSNNNIHVVWQDRTPGNYEIYYKKSTNGGTTWVGTNRLTWIPGNSEEPAIAADSSNNIHVAWYDDTFGKSEIFYKKSTNGGFTWAGTIRLTWNADRSHLPSITADSNDKIHIVWCDYSPGNWEIFYKKSTDGGTTWAGTIRLTWNSSSSYYPAITTDSNNHLHVVWHNELPNNQEIYYKKSTNGGASWTGAKRLTWNIGYSQTPAIATDANNKIHVVWLADVAVFAIIYKKSEDGGLTWTTRRLDMTYGMTIKPVVAIDASNNIQLVWYDDIAYNWEILHKRGIQ
jgi:hypothetical protein